MSSLTKFLLTITAFAPALLMYAFVSVINGDYLDAFIFAALCVVFVCFCLVVMSFMRRTLGPQQYTPKTVEILDDSAFNFLLVYLLPLITRDLSTYNWYIWILVTLFFCIVVATSYGYHYNPLLVIFRYHFYKVTEEGGIPHVLITRRRIYKLGEPLSVGELTDYVLIEK